MTEQQTTENQPAEPAAVLQSAVILHQRGEMRRAEVLYLDVLRGQPHNADALHLLGVLATQTGDAPRADALIRRAIAIEPRQAAFHSNLGHALMAQGRHAEALESLDRALLLRPDYAVALLNRGICLFHIDRLSDAVDSLSRSLEAAPDNPDALANRGAALAKLGRHTQALADYDRALERAPRLAAVHNDRGLVLQRLRRFEEALQSFDRALSLQPEFLAALNNRGWILRQLGRPVEAAASLERALAIKPDFVAALTNYGCVLADLEHTEEALTYFEAALKIDPQFHDALGNYAAALVKQSRYPAAIECLGRLLALAPGAEYALGYALNSRQRCCDWTDYEVRVAEIAAGVTRGQPVIDPFCQLAVADAPALQLECARMFGDRHVFPAGLGPPPPLRRAACGKIRLAYVSGEFREHAVSFLTAGLFEAHDRSRFEVIGVSLRSPRDTAMGRRLAAGFDRFLDVRSWADQDVVRRLRELEVDIAVDLSGWTGANRTGVFVQRAAPLQVNYLGFPGTMGLSCMDYIVADEFVIPPPSRIHYAEQVIYLPDSFQVNDAHRRISDAVISRHDCGLPDRGFIFCSFNNSYKINPRFFDIWMRLLAAVPDSVIWLLGDSELAQNNLRREARERGICADRMIFARRLPYEEHLRRLGLADLFLDSLPFNAGTTTSDALWAGVPVLTCPGAAFAARMSGSLLRAAGMPELIASDLAAYEALALRLALEPGLLSTVRAKLAVQRSTCPLFDTARFCRNLESAFQTMWDRHQRGDPPASFSVAP